MSAVNLQEWIGRTDQRWDTIDPGPMRRLAMTIDAPLADVTEGTPLPPLWHWVYFLGTATREGTAQDGHPKRGDFLPPVPQARRMYAGGSLSFHGPIRVGDHLQRVSTVMSVEDKTGRSGRLTIVRVRHEVGGETPVLTEEQDLVFIDRGTPPDIETLPVPEPQMWGERFITDEVLLFRFSALTFNSHRIHYDRDYATGVEGYRDLVVQGPLTAILLAEMARVNGVDLRTFRFRAQAPLYVGDPIHLRGTAEAPSVRMTAYDDRGVAAMEASSETA